MQETSAELLERLGVCIIDGEAAANALILKFDRKRFFVKRLKRNRYIFYNKDLDDAIENLIGSIDTLTILLKLIPATAKFFIDELGQGYCEFVEDTYTSYFPLEDAEFKKKVITWCMQADETPTREKIHNIVSVCQGLAIESKRKYPLHNRVAKIGSNIYVDMTSENWMMVEINNEGYRKVAINYPLFRRYSHMRSMEISEGTKRDLDRFISLLNINKEDEILLASYFAVSFIEDIPYPILQITGPEGSGKTTASKNILRLIDNSETDSLPMPKDTEEAILILSQRHAVAFDNVKIISGEVADLFCSAVTTTSVTKRKLYTDADNIILNLHNTIILNGILETSRQPDLKDRFLTLELAEIGRHKRIPEVKINEQLEDLLPKVRGYLFESLSKSIDKVSAVRDRMDSLPRLASFCIWGETVAQVMGQKPGAFYNAYTKRINEQARRLLEEHPLANYIIDLLESNNSTRLEFTTNEFHGRIKSMIEADGAKLKDVYCPASPNGFTQILKRFTVTLDKAGWLFEKQNDGKTRKYIFSKIKEENSSIIMDYSKSDTILEDGLGSGYISEFFPNLSVNLRDKLTGLQVLQVYPPPFVSTTPISLLQFSSKNLSEPVTCQDTSESLLQVSKMLTGSDRFEGLNNHSNSKNMEDGKKIQESDNTSTITKEPPETHKIGSPSSYPQSPNIPSGNSGNAKKPSIYTLLIERFKKGSGYATKAEAEASVMPHYTQQEASQALRQLLSWGDIYAVPGNGEMYRLTVQGQNASTEE